MLIYCVSVTLPIRQILYIAQETLFLWMLMAILFACALFFLASLILLHSGVRSTVHGIRTRVAKLIGSGGQPLTSRGPMLHLPSRR
jgi:hypothetical protein